MGTNHKPTAGEDVSRRSTNSNYLACLLLTFCLAGLAGNFRAYSQATSNPLPDLKIEKSSWHGFDRYDFIMDNESLAITPYKSPDGEGNGVRSPEQGKRRCILVVPRKAAKGNPWSWQGCYWDHQPQAEIELLNRGFHIAFITPDPGKQWDAWYAYLTGQFGLAKKPAFIGMSRGGYNAYTWATANPEKVTCIYGDNPAISPESLVKLGPLAKNNVPLLNICGSIDPLLGNHTLVMESYYKSLGGRISVMIKDGYAHHPHSLPDPKPIADFIEQSFYAEPEEVPAFAGTRYTKSSFYSSAETYREYPEEKASITCRGPWFSACFTRYEFRIDGIRGGISVITPKKAAPGNPWVFRTDYVGPDAAVDLALLEKGFHIVTGPVPTDVDGPVVEQWNLVYKYLTDKGFSKKPVMEGWGGSVGEVYAWAIENPDKVSCIYGENPIFHSFLAQVQPLDNLAPLSKAGIQILHVCGSQDPSFSTQTKHAEKKYKNLGGRMEVIVIKGEGHKLNLSKNLDRIVSFITQRAG